MSQEKRNKSSCPCCCVWRCSSPRNFLHCLCPNLVKSKIFESERNRDDGLDMTAAPFHLHDPAVGGHAGDSTLEFLIKAPPTGNRHSALFWTGPSSNPLNLIHVYWGTGGCQDCVVGDWHSPISGKTSMPCGICRSTAPLPA